MPGTDLEPLELSVQERMLQKLLDIMNNVTLYIEGYKGMCHQRFIQLHCNNSAQLF